jgi:crooked neck
VFALHHIHHVSSSFYLDAQYAELESSLSEFDRTRAIFNLAISQPTLDMPEILWKSYIDFEIAQKDYERVRHLYGELMTRTKHVKVWISRAQFEVQTTKEMEQARTIYTEADAYLKQQQNKDEVRNDENDACAM